MYLDAVLRDQPERAAAMLGPKVGSSCRADLERAHVPTSITARLVASSIDGDQARVQIRFEQPESGPFGGSYGFDERFVLERSDGQWKISEPSWPVFGCDR